jgi:hypothetical protein
MVDLYNQTVENHIENIRYDIDIRVETLKNEIEKLQNEFENQILNFKQRTMIDKLGSFYFYSFNIHQNYIKGKMIAGKR